MRVVCVAGTRPNFMKIKPVISALRSGGAETIFVHTGQHYDQVLSDVFLDELGLPSPDYHLGVGPGSQAEQTAKVMMALEPVLGDLRPDVVVVVGDVNSTVAAALVTAKSGSLLAHVEAGLRSRDWSMPEEVNRTVTDRVSDYLFAPSSDAVNNLRAEGYREDQIHLVGNVMVDTLLDNLGRARCRPILADLEVEPKRYGVVTLHRPSNVDDPRVLGRIVSALRKLAVDVPLIFPAHPRTRRQLAEATPGPRLRIVEALGYLDFLALEDGALVVLTDSGGVQEETTVLGVPCLTLREQTERPITVSDGTNQVVGLDPERIVVEGRRALFRPVQPRRPPLWDGHAGERVASVLLESGSGSRKRPTELTSPEKR